MATPLGLRILFVEDNDEIREALATLLEAEGYEVTACPTAEDGLAALQTRGTFHLVLSDYSLPNQNGAWMIQEAAAQGLITRDRVLVVTAHPSPRGLEGIKIIHKPLDLDDFLREVYDALAPARAQELERTRTRIDSELRAARPIARVELALYISSTSPTSLKAIRNVERVLRHYDPAHVALSVMDLSRERTPLADEDRIAFTPTLVKRKPTPRAWVLGNMENASVLEDLLSGAGLEKKT